MNKHSDLTLILETKIHKVTQGDLELSFVAQAGLLSDPLPLASGVAGIIGLPLLSCFVSPRHPKSLFLSHNMGYNLLGSTRAICEL